MTDLFSGDVQNSTPESRSDRRRQRRRRAERRKNIISFLVMVGALALLVGGAWFFVKPMLSEMGESEAIDFEGPGSGSAEIVVSEGESGSAIGTTLVDAGVVKTLEAFTSAYSANPNATSIQPGTYTLPKEMKAVDAVAALLDPAYKSDLRITIPEGWTAAQVYDRVAGTLDVAVEDVEAAAKEVGETLPSDAKGNLEGWLAPATFTVGPKEDAVAVLTQMVDLTKKTLADLDVPEEDQQDLIIKASIVEKEVPPEQEYREKVARVIENRLEGCSGDGTLGMDTTAVYAFGKPYNQISEAELADSDYNTRIHPGLPPTPIGSPSSNALEAVLDPPEGSWCYFVTINLETQETVFTDDIREHDKNWAKFQDYLKKAIAESDESDEQE